MKVSVWGEYTLRWIDTETGNLVREVSYKNTITHYGRTSLYENGALNLATMLLFEKPTLANPKPDPAYMGTATLSYDAPQPPSYIFRKRKKATFHDKDARNRDVTGKVWYGLGIAFRGGASTLDEWEPNVFSKVILEERDFFSIASNEYLEVIYTIHVVPSLADNQGTYVGGSYLARRADIEVLPSNLYGYDVVVPQIGSFVAYETNVLGDIRGHPSGRSYTGSLENLFRDATVRSCESSFKIPYTSLNLPDGKIGSIVTEDRSGWNIRFQIAFNPPLEKTEENVLQLVLKTWYTI